MPLNILRLNQRHQHPTPHIIFIKPLPGPSSTQASHILSRVAAICHPVLADNHISVTTLEEHEWNREFIGRNFNAGECIQLVLRTRSGAWLPFRSVVMVAMHELAHCKQMNHSRAFWAVRNTYAEQMHGLWARGYTGEGVWGRGRELDDGSFEDGHTPLPAGEEMPAALCGGTFRSRRRGGRKRKREGLSYAERQKRRVEKKFGVGGEKLGEDQIVKFFLDGSKIVIGKPRVAASQRGRELRAQAALVRLGALTKDNDDDDYDDGEMKTELKSESNAASDDDDDGDEDEDSSLADALDINGCKLFDSNGQTMIKIEDIHETDNDIHIKGELDELNALTLWNIPEHKPDMKQEIKQEIKQETKQEGTATPAIHQNNSQAARDMRSNLDTFHHNGSVLLPASKKKSQPQRQRQRHAVKGSVLNGGAKGRRLGTN